MPQLAVFNKVDNLAEPILRTDRDGDGVPIRVWLSALQGTGIDGLRDAIAARLGIERIDTTLDIPLSAGRLRARLHAQALVREETLTDSGWSIRIDAPRSVIEPLFGLPDGDGAWLRSRLSTPETDDWLA